jgi:peptidoglycan/xylan/chitin deacetylase (PgdA/CDA1 family)
VSARSRAIRGLASGLYRTGALRPAASAALRLRAADAFTILTFHRVNDEADPFFPSLSPTVFAARMRHLAEHYVVLPLEDLVERQRRGRVPRRAVAVTFDDGYHDTLTHAAPILARHGLPATVFLATGYISGSEMPWYDRLAHALKTSPKDAADLGIGRRLPLGGPAERLEALEAALQHMKGLPDADRRRALDRLVDELDPPAADAHKRLMLTWDEAQALLGLGFSIGAHTVTHPILSRLDPEAMWAEIDGSRAAIERNLGIRVRAFAYPNGGADDYDARALAAVERAGFTCAVTTRRGLNTPRTPRFELRRGGPWEQHLPTYAMKMAWYQLTGA